MTRVGLDTNALMMPVELDVRVFDELERLLDDVEPVTVRAVVEELRRLSDGGMGEEAMAASVGLDLATERCRIVEHGESYADDAVVELAEAGSFDYVVTNDGPLKERVLETGVPVIGLRGRNKLAITQP
jgi:rRNA-processing protein FCF1